MGRFVEIAIAAGAADRECATAVVRACPVAIFRHDEDGGLRTYAEREDECILCGRCLAVAPNALTVRRAYGARRMVSASGGDGD